MNSQNPWTSAQTHIQQWIQSQPPRTHTSSITRFAARKKPVRSSPSLYRGWYTGSNDCFSHDEHCETFICMFSIVRLYSIVRVSLLNSYYPTRYTEINDCFSHDEHCETFICMFSIVRLYYIVRVSLLKSYRENVVQCHCNFIFIKNVKRQAIHSWGDYPTRPAFPVLEVRGEHEGWYSCCLAWLGLRLNKGYITINIY